MLILEPRSAVDSNFRELLFSELESSGTRSEFDEISNLASFISGKPISLRSLVENEQLPDSLSPEQKKLLASLGNQVVRLVELRLQNRRQTAQAQESAHHLEEALNLFKQTPVAIALLRGPSHEFFFANQLYLRMLGDRDLLGRTVAEALPEMAESEIHDLLDRVYETGDPHHGKEFRLPIRAASGEVEFRYFDFIYQPWRDPAGEVGGITVAATDVTEDVNARDRIAAVRDELSLSESELIDTLESMRDCFFSTDANWRITRVNGHHEQFSGKSRLQDIGRDLWEAYFAVDGISRETYWKFYNKVMRERSPVTFQEYYAPKDAWISVDVFPKTDGGLAIFYRDITSERDAEKLIQKAARELAAEKQKQDSIIAQSPAGVALLRGPGLVFEKVNEKFTGLVSERPYLGRTWIEVYPELVNPPFPALMAKVLATGEPYFESESKIRVEVAPGEVEERYYDINYERVCDGDGKPYGIFIQCSNVSERVQSREAMQAIVKDLETEREIRERFVATLTHDLRTPLTAAKLAAQLLPRKAEDPAAIKKMAVRISTSVDRAEYMVKDLLDANRIKAGDGIPVEFSECALNETVHHALAELRHVTGDRFEFVPAEKEIRGWWDREALQRIVENLASNAVKYGKTLTPITVTVIHSESFAEISVHNEGDPIKPADQLSIFHGYHRTETALSSGQKGWGIGLMLVTSLVEAHRGSIAVKSEAGYGTKFTVRLPLDSRVAL